MFSLAALSKLWEIRGVRGAAYCVGMLVALVWHGSLRYHDGVSAGIREEKAAWQAEATRARAIEAQARTRSDAVMFALRDSLRMKSQQIAQLSEASALARGKYSEALLQYQLAKLHARDTLTVPAADVPRACDAVVSACANALAVADSERVALVDKLRLAELTAQHQDSVITTEPARVSLTVRDALAEQRASQATPHRALYVVGGAVLGSLLTLVVHR